MQMCSDFINISIPERRREKIKRSRLNHIRQDHKNLVFTENAGLGDYVAHKQEQTVHISILER